jgi:hypothetical protein
MNVKVRTSQQEPSKARAKTTSIDHDVEETESCNAETAPIIEIAQYTDAEIERLWQRLLYEGTQHTNRVNFYMVAQSMFFAAFASNQRQNFFFSLACVSAGIIMSVLWMQMARDQDVVVKHTRRVLAQHCREYKDFANVINKPQRITQGRLSVSLPRAMIILWVLAGIGDFLTLVIGIK